MQLIRNIAAALIALAAASSLAAQEPPPAQVFFEGELGAVKVLSHTYRVGEAGVGSDFDFVTQGGQELLFPFQRLTAALTLGGRHQFRFLYQPLELVTASRFREDVRIDNVLFPADTPTRVTYGFPFYRLTYQYRLLGDGRGNWLAGGLALQLRNASIKFESLDGSLLTVSQNLGLVPALALSGRASLGAGLFASFDATGIYASSAFVNGADFKFEGSLLDASLRLGTAIRPDAEAWLNLRFLGGTAAGTSGYAREEWTNSLSPTTENRLATLALTIGATVR